MGGISSKTEFQNNFAKLLTSDILPTNGAYWDEMWKASVSLEDIFDVVSVTQIRKLITSKPGNLKILFTQAIAQLYQVVETPYPIYFPQALNCIRILTRLLPTLLENESLNKNKLITELLWKKQNILQNPNNIAKSNDDATQQDSKDGGHGSPAVVTGDDSDSSDILRSAESEPLAVILINAMFHLLFLPDFTIENPNQEFTEKDVESDDFRAALMWAPGVGSKEKTIISSTEFDLNRIEILRLMLASFCDSLYQTPENFDNCASYWLEVATSVDVPYAEIVFNSLMNTVLGYDPVGWGLPYGNAVSTDTAKLLMEAAVQVLITLLDYGHPIRPFARPKLSLSTSAIEAASDNGIVYANYDETEVPGFNVFRRFLHSVSDPPSLNFIFRGFSRLLNNIHESDNSYLPYSMTRIGVEQELLILLWKCLEEIPQFMTYILKHCDVTELVLPICYFMLSGRKDPAKTGLMYLCTFCLLKLSGERSFGVALNKSYQLRLPVDVPLFVGTYADLLIIVLHKMIVSGSERLISLYHCFLTTICNVSPYCKGLCSVSSIKIINLFQLFMSPQFLYQAESNHAYVSLLLETMNNIIQYQYESNSSLVYAIVKRKEVFEELAQLSLPKAISEATTHHANNTNHLMVPVKEDASRQPSQSSSENAKNASENVAPTKVKANNRVPPPSSPDHSASVTVAAMPVVSTTDVVIDKSVISASDTEYADKCDAEPPVSATNESATDVNNVKETVPAAASVKESISGEEQPIAASNSSDTNDAPKPSSVPSVAAPAVFTSSTDLSASVTPPPPSRFVPSKEWLKAVKAELPLLTIMRLLKHLVPLIEELAATHQKNHHSAPTEQHVLSFIKSTTMVGLLPVPHPIVIRKYQPNRYTSLWFTAFQWGVVFMHNQENIQLFDGDNIKLFTVHSVPLPK